MAKSKRRQKAAVDSADLLERQKKDSTDEQEVVAGSVSLFHPVTQQWFNENFKHPTRAQEKAWPSIAAGKNTLLLAPTGSGKTLAAFLVAIDRLMFQRRPPIRRDKSKSGVRTLYISPLKALGVDVERNLRAPLAGVQVVAQREGYEYQSVGVGVRSGDTPSTERTRLQREPPEILITTPESLFLMLTSKARESLLDVDTVIIDEIHSLVRGKRGAHLFLSLERLEALRRRSQPDVSSIQRIGLSATQRPLEEIARLLGGGETPSSPDAKINPRPVEIVEAGRAKQLELTIEVPVDDMAQLNEPVERSGSAAAGPTRASIWPAIHPRLVELIREHRVTILFVNSRRLAERLATAINEIAEETIAMAHHGSLAKETRTNIEDRLKRGTLPAIVATSSLELGIDMGAVDLVIQIEAPPSIASGLQRVGRAGHQVDAVSKGIVFPKFRGDLLACSAAVERMLRGEVEETFYPRNPLDVLAQQIVAMVALEVQEVDELYQTCRQSAPFFELPRSVFEGVLDLLAGRYPSDEFSELKARVTWDRVAGKVLPRRGTQQIAIANAGTIPDRGLYGVFLADGQSESTTRVGELDEEMVFETKPGDVFLLGASSWKAVEITHDRVLVVPAPGEPGRMPFWRGDGPGRPLEFGRAIGSLTRRLLEWGPDKARETLIHEHGLDERAALNLCQYLIDQSEATGEVPSDRTIVFESFVDEIGDWRIVLLSPHGARVHAPWAMAVAAQLEAEIDGEVDTIWSDDGIVWRLPESDAPPPVNQFLPQSDEVEDRVVNELGTTAMFATHFRENAARSLLLPRRRIQSRTPLWMQRRKSADLLRVAARYERFPIILETYRECLRDVFDLPGLQHLLQQIEQRFVRVHAVETSYASPFAASLMFNYTANFLYEGDAPLAERRAATLALDPIQLRELLGDAELRELLDAEVVEQAHFELQRLDEDFAVKHPDQLHDLLQAIGDLSVDEIASRTVTGTGSAVASSDETQTSSATRSVVQTWLDDLLKQRRVCCLPVASESRYIAAEDAARYRDALGVALPPGLPQAFLDPVEDPLGDLVSRFARTHIPFLPETAARRLGLGVAPILTALKRLERQDRVIEGEFLPGGRGREWCAPSVLQLLKRRSLAKLRKQVAPVDSSAFARFLGEWQSVHRPRRGLDGLLDIVEQLQGTAVPASDLERAILPARLHDYRSSQLDELCAAGEVVWRGIESIGTQDGRIALYLTDHFEQLTFEANEPEHDLDRQVLDLLEQQNALFFDDIHRGLGQFPPDVFGALWRLVWLGRVTNDTLAPLRSLRVGMESRKSNRSRRRAGGFRSRRAQRLMGSEGRWSLLPQRRDERTTTELQTNRASQLIERFGIVTREVVRSENIEGGFAGLYPVFRAMEEAGKVRRGYFIAGQGAAQFAAPGAEDRLRERKKQDEASSAIVLAACDPANPFGGSVKWPEATEADSKRPQRTAGARVILVDGALVGYLSKSGKRLLTFLPEHDPERTQARTALVEAIVSKVADQGPLLLEQIDDVPADQHPLATQLMQTGFRKQNQGLLLRRSQSTDAVSPPSS